MRGTAIVTAAAETHPGLQRPVNEDRCHADPIRGIFAVVDGVGGHAAGERAAETALAMLRARLERETGPIEDRVREAIAVAATEVHRQAGLRPEWRGMACVLTVAVLDDERGLVIGHVGDTRLYKIRRGRMEKLTRDHSPVGEREDAGELTEQAAMSHPRRNEVYRDVGSEPHGANDADFVDIVRAPFEPDAAILLCSDGLTDYVPSDVILKTVERLRGRPHEVARALIDAANAAGGKDNISVVYAEGPGVRATEVPTERTAPPRAAVAAEPVKTPVVRPWLLWALVLTSWAVVAFAAYFYRDRLFTVPPGILQPAGPSTVTVAPGASIGAAVQAAREGSVVLVQPGEYRERLALRTGVEIRSLTPRGAVLRLPPDAGESDPAVHAADVRRASLVGFRIVGDAATPLGIGVLLENADVTLENVEISGASRAAIQFGAGSGGTLLAAHVHDNPGSALVVRERAAPRVSHSVFARNGTASPTTSVIFLAPGAAPEFRQNTFVGLTPAAVAPPGGATEAIERQNSFPAPATPRGTAPPRQGRGR